MINIYWLIRNMITCKRAVKGLTWKYCYWQTLKVTLERKYQKYEYKQLKALDKCRKKGDL